MNPFEYVTAQTVASAPELVKDGGRFFAGGNDLLGEMKDYIAAPKRLVNIKALPDTHDIKIDGAVCFIGTNVTVAQIAAHPKLGELYPGLVEAAREVASPQIRNVATLGGNLAQHSRCWYYRHKDLQCLKRGGATCYAREGENKYHAIFSGNPCISPITSNMATALAALDGRAAVRRGNGTVTLSMAELYRDAWTNPLAHNSLGPTDLIIGVELPAKSGTKSAYLQVSEKSEFDWALASCAVAAVVEGKTLRKPRIALGQVAPVPYESEAVNSFLDGKALDEAAAARAGEMMLSEAAPFEHNAYKIPLAQALIRRALLRLVS